MGKILNDPEGYHKCSQCGEILPLTTEYFSKNNSCHLGFSSMCKKCRGFKSYGINIGKINKDLMENGLRKCSFCNEIKPLSEFKFVGKTRWAESCSSCIELYKIQKSEYDKQYYKENKNKKDIYYKQWKLNGGQKLRNINESHRRAQKLELLHDLTNEEWKYCLDYFNYSCAYCGISEKENREKYLCDLNKEHLYPQSKGGHYTRTNLVPSCRSCNSKKNNKDVNQFFIDNHLDKNKLYKIFNYLAEIEDDTHYILDNVIDYNIKI